MIATDTRAFAREQIAPSAATLRERVLRFLQSRGAEGATDEEIQHRLFMPGNTERPRRRELEQAGQVYASGYNRVTASGRAAVVWRAR
jgi:hypothetical protein